MAAYSLNDWFVMFRCPNAVSPRDTSDMKSQPVLRRSLRLHCAAVSFFIAVTIVSTPPASCLQLLEACIQEILIVTLTDV
jgi:hypothetical protein